MKIVWTARAAFDYDDVIAYLLEAWSEREAQDFIDEVALVLKHLPTTPAMFEGSEKSLI